MKHYVENVHDVTRMIPRGRVTTYGAIADFLTLGSARMAGFALKQSIGADDLPAHRVLNRNGELSGRNAFPTPTWMQEALEAEGVEVVDNKVVDFDTLFWHPTEIPQ